MANHCSRILMLVVYSLDFINLFLYILRVLNDTQRN